MSKIIKGIMAVACVALTGGAGAEVTPKLLINFAFNATPEVTGWHRHYQNGGGKLGGDGITENGITFSTTSGGNFYERAKVSGDYQTGTYVGIDGTTEYTSVTDEIAGSLGFGESIAFTDDVWKTGLMNGGVSGHTATISGLSASKKYVVYLGYGLYKSDGPTQQPGFEVISGGYSSVESIQYVKNTDSSYQNYTSGQIKPDGSGLMVVRVKDLVPTANGEFQFKLVGDRAGMNFLAVGELEGAGGTTIDCDDVFTATDAEALDSADVYNLTIPANGTFTVDKDLTRSYNLISAGTITLTGANLTTENLAKLVNQTQGYIYRIESDLSAGTTPGLGEGTYSYKNAKITNAPSEAYKFVVKDGDAVNLAASRILASLEIQGGAVTIGDVNGSGSFWFGGKSTTTYNQTGGVVTSTANGTGTSTANNGLLLGWTGQMASMTVSGGTLQVPNSSLNFWDGSTTLNVSGGTVKAKGVFKGNSSGHQVVLSDAGTFELGSIGWTGVGLTLNGGTLKAYESTTMAADITLNDAATVEVPATVELKLTGSVTGTGVITKTGEGILNVGTARPTMDVQSGSVKIVATPTELVAGKLTLSVPQDASSASEEKVSVWDSEGNEVEITDVSLEGTTITITLKTLPSISTDKSISELELDPAAAGLVVVEGGATEEESIAITFDAALPENVSMEINGFVEFVSADGVEIPYAKMTFGEGATLIFEAIDGYTVPAGAAVIAGTASGTITNAGTLTIKGDSTFKLANTGTLNLVSGTSTISSDAQAIKGTINIAYGAVYKCDSNDQVPYGGSTTTTINVRGTLDMQNHRWTLGGADTINLYGGCTVLGQGDNAGLFDLYREGNIINVYAGEGEQATETTVTLPAPIRARNANGNIFIAQGMKLALAGGIKNADVSGATINMNGNGRLTGTVALKGGFYLNLGNAVGTIDAKFVAESGDTALKLGESDYSVQITTSDSKDEPIIWVKPGATLQLYVKDFSSWNQAVTEYGWIKNEGTLNFYENGGSRYFRGHLVMKPGTTTTIYGTAQNFIIYGGANDVAKAQVVVPASEEPAVATLAGEGKIQLNVNGSGGTPNSAWDIGANATLDVQTAIIGGETLAKYGAGQLKLTGDLSGYTGSINLKAGTVFVANNCDLEANKITTDLQGMKVTAKGVAGGKLYKVSPKSFTISIQ